MTKGLIIILTNPSLATKRSPASQRLSPRLVILVGQGGTERERESEQNHVVLRGPEPGSGVVSLNRHTFCKRSGPKAWAGEGEGRVTGSPGPQVLRPGMRHYYRSNTC